MKKVIGVLVFLIAAAFISCKKDTIKPEKASENIQQTSTVTGARSTTGSASTNDSLNNVRGILRLRLQLNNDTVNSDNILLNFDPTSQPAYTPGKDAPTMQGFGKVSLSSFSSNNIPLSIYTLPLNTSGVKIRLRVNAQNDGVYFLNMTAIKSIPEAYDMWLMDAYKKDSLEIRYNHSYAFNIIKADSNSFGVNRFKLVIRTR